MNFDIPTTFASQVFRYPPQPRSFFDIHIIAPTSFKRLPITMQALVDYKPTGFSVPDQSLLNGPPWQLKRLEQDTGILMLFVNEQANIPLLLFHLSSAAHMFNTISLKLCFDPGEDGHGQSRLDRICELAGQRIPNVHVSTLRHWADPGPQEHYFVVLRTRGEDEQKNPLSIVRALRRSVQRLGLAL